MDKVNFLTHIRLRVGFLGPDTSYRTKKGVLLSTICFLKEFPIRLFSEFSNLFEFLKIFRKAKQKSRNYKVSKKMSLKLSNTIV